ncbi:unnamed protein product, partial [marine sediment metagenome]
MSSWQPNSDDVFRCLYRMMQNAESCDSFPVLIQNTDPMPVALCQSICLHLDTYKENYLLFNSLGLCVLTGTTVWSDPVELEDVKEIAFTVQRNAGHCGLS